MSLRQTSFKTREVGDNVIIETDTLIETYNQKGNITSHYYNAIRKSTNKQVGASSTMAGNKVSVLFFYDKDFRLSKKEVYHTLPYPDTSVYEYTYNEKGQEIEHTVNSQKAKGYSVKQFYDEQGRLNKDVTTNIPGKKEGNYITPEIYTYQYSVKNGLLEKVTYTIANGKNTLVRSASYDKGGNIIGEIFYENNIATMRAEYIFDNESRLMKESTFYPETDKINKSKFLSYTYSNFDNKGNYLKKATSAGVEFIRVIEYY